jgi:hypothetical protein
MRTNVLSTSLSSPLYSLKNTLHIHILEDWYDVPISHVRKLATGKLRHSYPYTSMRKNTQENACTRRHTQHTSTRAHTSIRNHTQSHASTREHMRRNKSTRSRNHNHLTIRSYIINTINVLSSSQSTPPQKPLCEPKSPTTHGIQNALSNIQAASKPTSILLLSPLSLSENFNIN